MCDLFFYRDGCNKTPLGKGVLRGADFGEGGGPGEDQNGLRPEKYCLRGTYKRPASTMASTILGSI